jgi:hypothetical protein
MFQPGHIIPESSPYLVRHDAHRAEHAVNAVGGDVFPKCKICGDKVRYVKLNREMFTARDLLNEDPGFTQLDVTVRL